ncbi:lipoprotein [Shigella phage vB_SflS-ISF001]|uniref:Lipoprotein n=1 Tax=Shigella phage vB_SflS-ISF001 TaxID=2048005 RepID=A0A2D1GQ04_9CAUD|nr:lipoprotein [Shigella phage vB_SflS-ISF001]ATN94097.1 lipoprotein [Shigella phage vB_SflS-ISF001]
MIKLITIIAAAFILTGFAQNHKNGDCVTFAYGSCMMRFVDGKRVPAGEIGTPFKGLWSDDDQGNFSAKVRIITKEW